MPDQVKRYTDPVKARWELLTRPQQYKLIAAIVGVIIALALMAFFAFRTPWVVIVNNEDWNVIAPMLNELDAAGIPARETNRGTGIEVDSRRREEARVAIITSDRAPNSEHFRWADAFDTGLGTTDDQRRLMHQRGIEGAIATQLVAVNGIHGAIVNIDIPSQRPFDRNAPTPVAAVTLTTSQSFTPQQGRNLAYIVARNISTLQMEDITIIDQHLNTIFNGAEDVEGDIVGTAQQFRDQQRNISTLAVQRLFAPAFNEVEVTVSMAFDEQMQAEISEEIFSIPEGMDDTGIMRTEQARRAEMEGSPGGLEPGLQPQTATFPNYLMPGGGVMSASEREHLREFLVNRQEIVTLLGPGGVDPERSSASIVAVLEVPLYQGHWMAEDEERTQADWEIFVNANLNPRIVNGEFDQFEYFHQLASTALGFPAENINLLVMERMVPTHTEMRVWDIPTFLMVAVLFLLLLLLLIGLLRRQRIAGEDEESLEPQLEIEGLLATTQLDEAKEIAVQELEEIDYFKENEIKKHIEKFVNEKPEAVAALLRNWINVEEW